MHIEHTHKARIAFQKPHPSRAPYHVFFFYHDSPPILVKYETRKRENWRGGRKVHGSKNLMPVEPIQETKGKEAGVYSAIWRVLNNFYC
jgi:hypothetical protein